MNNREFIARRIAQEFKSGEVVNLGVGLPTMVVDYIPEDIHIMLQAENGILGVGPKAAQGKERLDCIDSGGNYVTTMEGACFLTVHFHFPSSAEGMWISPCWAPWRSTRKATLQAG